MKGYLVVERSYYGMDGDYYRPIKMYLDLNHAINKVARLTRNYECTEEYKREHQYSTTWYEYVEVDLELRG